MERISSPEQLNDYIRVSSPSVWLLLGAILALLVGACIWGVFGRLDTRVGTKLLVRDGSAVCYVREEDAASVQAGMPVTANGWIPKTTRAKPDHSPSGDSVVMIHIHSKSVFPSPAAEERHFLILRIHTRQTQNLKRVDRSCVSPGISCTSRPCHAIDNFDGGRQVNKGQSVRKTAQKIPIRKRR